MIILRRINTIIGRGSHWDKIAIKAIERKQKLENSALFVSECGLGASGLPHIGSFADASRAYVIKRAVEDTGLFETIFYAFADDLDGLRKVPAGLPMELQEWLGVPVTRIPDHDECHNNYGNHMVSLLLDSLDQANIEYTFLSAAKLYEKGKFREQISKILSHHDKVGQIIYEETGQEKYLEEIPYHAICKNCGRIYTTTITELDSSNDQLKYLCKGAEIGDKNIEGCGDQSWINFTMAKGKLNWKVEFAARWSVLNVDFEPYGKDILESVNTNNRISKEILDYQPPYQIKYEMFLDKKGTKISKSKGNVLTPQTWFEFGSPQSLILMTLKRIEGSRTLSHVDIPRYMDEFNELEALYFGLIDKQEKMEKTQLQALYEYCWWLNPPNEHSLTIDKNGRYQPVSYTLLSHLSQFVPENVETKYFLRRQLEDYKLIQTEEDWEKISEWIDYPIRWSQKGDNGDKWKLELSNIHKKAIDHLIKEFEKINFVENEIQKTVFGTGKEFKISPKILFPILYEIFLGVSYGPRIGKIIALMGRKAAIEKLQKQLSK